MSTRVTWRLVGSAALAATMLLAAGFAYAVYSVVNPAQPAEAGERLAVSRPPNPLAVQEKLNIVALGDSLTRGTGDETGKGYVGYTRDKLAERYGKPVFVLANYAVNGYRSEQLLQDLQTKSGIADALKQAHIILITIGGNDLFSFGTEPSIDKIRGNVQPTLQRLEHILDTVYKINPEARTVYLGLYNPFIDMDELKPLSLEAADWNRQAYGIVHKYPNMTMVPTYDLFEQRVGAYLSSDHFHPNGLGYERMADRIVQVLE